MVSAFKGVWLIPDIILATVLVFSYIYLRTTRQLLPAYVMASSAFMGFLLIHVVTEGADYSGPLSCFVYPPAVLYMLGLRLGLAFSLIAVFPMTVFLIMRLAGLEAGVYTSTFLLRFLLAYFSETLLFYLVQSQKIKAQKEVKVLSGFLPICASCIPVILRIRYMQ